MSRLTLILPLAAIFCFAMTFSLATPVLRFAPTPNGLLHLGHAYSALRNAETAARLGAKLLLRFEDTDQLLRRVDVRVSLPNGCLCLLFACTDLFIVEQRDDLPRFYGITLSETNLRNPTAGLGRDR